MSASAKSVPIIGRGYPHKFSHVQFTHNYMQVVNIETYLETYLQDERLVCYFRCNRTHDYRVCMTLLSLKRAVKSSLALSLTAQNG